LRGNLFFFLLRRERREGIEGVEGRERYVGIREGAGVLMQAGRL
jgi:hypothetical protein